MSKFCTRCGAQLVPGGRFCKICGSPAGAAQVAPPQQTPQAASVPAEPAVTVQQTPVRQPVSQEAAPAAQPATPDLRQNGRLQSSVQDGAPVRERSGEAPDTARQERPAGQNIISESTIRRAVGAAKGLAGNSSFAQAAPGEFSFVQSGASALASASAILGPAQVLLSGGKRMLGGLKAAWKDKKKLIPALIMAVLWILLTLLPALGVRIPSSRLLNFLTFARGGMSGGVAGFVGGVIGKGIFAYFIMALIVPLFSGKNPMTSLKGGFTRLLGSFAIKDAGALVPLLGGAGAALIVYNFLNASTYIGNSMAAISVFFLTVRALSSKAGFLRGFLRSLLYKIGKNKLPSGAVVNRIMAGFAAGSALAIPLSLLPPAFIGYLCGGLFAVAAVIVYFAAGQNKGRVAA